jgi:hypothetical protein
LVVEADLDVRGAVGVPSGDGIFDSGHCSPSFSVEDFDAVTEGNGGFGNLAAALEGNIATARTA